MTDSPIRVGIASFAHVHAPAYAASLREIENVTFVGIWDDIATRGQQRAEEYGTHFYERLEDLLGSIDTLVVASENSRHKEIVLAAAAARVPVLCEKPLATNTADAREMIAACAAAGVQLGTAFPVRYSYSVRQLRSAVQSGKLGETLMIRATNRGTYPGSWFGDKQLSGGGALMDHIVHVADLLRWIWEREFTEVYAEADTRYHDLAVDDCGLVLITLDGGVTASLDPSWSRPNQSFPTWGDVTMEVTGTGGVCALDVFGQHSELFSNKLVRAQELGWGDNLDLLMIRDWLRAIREHAPAPISGEDGMRVVELVQAAYESVRTHQPVQLAAH